MAAENPFAPEVRREAEAYDPGLRDYMRGIYNYMAGALVLTGAMAFFSARSEAFLGALYVIQDNAVAGMKPLGWIVMLAPLALAIFLGFGIRTMSLPAVQLSFWAYAALIGMSLSIIFLMFTEESIARVFFITAGTFGGMSLYGYTTKRDLTELGSFLIMGLVGIIIASLVNLFLRSSGLQFALSVMAVLVFTGLTAFDTQKLLRMYDLFPEGETRQKAAIIGALTLYLDFINIFLNLLNLFGERRR